MAINESKIIRILDENGPDSHGSAALYVLREEFRKSKTSEVMSFLTAECVRPPVLWNDVSTLVWDDSAADKNRFPFLQGDVIRTTLVKRPGHSELSVENSLWLVCSPTCDAVRARFIRVAPLFRVVTDAEDSDAKSKLKIACSLASSKRFAIPRFPDDTENVSGYYADFEEPFFVTREDADQAVPLRTLTMRGWHLFSMIVLDGETRANPEEEEKIRSFRLEGT